MRAYAGLKMSSDERRLVAARPLSPTEISASTIQITPADGAPLEIRLPDLDLWNRVEPVTPKLAQSDDGQISLAWDAQDAGWHVSSGWPGMGHNVVVAGHSPSRNPQAWSHSIFRQLAYLTPGDQIELTAGSRRYFYAVDRVFAIPAQEADTLEAGAWIASGSAERLTLVTCWPPHTAAYRVIVIAQPVRSEPVMEVNYVS